MATKKTAKKATKKKVIKKAAKKKVVKKTTKRPTVKVVKKTVVKKTVVSKTVKKQIASNKKSTKRALKHNVKQDTEISKLKAEVARLAGKGKVKGKKKVNSKRVSEYNLFIRKQIKAGYTFIQAVKEWNKYQTLMSKDKRRPSAYNQFIGSQMRLGKSFKESVRLWKLAKAGKLGRKGTTKTITKTVTKRIKSKPKVKYVTRNVKTKPIIKYKTRVVRDSLSEEKIKSIIVSSIKSASSVKPVTKSDSEEQTALDIIETYFGEVARLGLKRQLTLDEIINSYLYTLARVKREDVELMEVARILKEKKVRK